MEDPVTSIISETDITTFQNDGAVCLRGAFDQKWVDLLRKGIEANRLHPSEMTKRKGHSPLFFHDYNNWSCIPEYKEFIFHSRVGEIAARFLQSSVRNSKVVFTLCTRTLGLGTGHKRNTCAHREPVPNSVFEYKVSGRDTMPEFWLGYLTKGCVHISAQRESFSGTVLGNQV